jgi:hypothetical protein
MRQEIINAYYTVNGMPNTEFNTEEEARCFADLMGRSIFHLYVEYLGSFNRFSLFTDV